MLGNLGVLLAAALVTRFDAHWPDTVIGLIIAAVVVRSAVRVVREAHAQLSRDPGPNVSAGRPVQARYLSEPFGDSGSCREGGVPRGAVFTPLQAFGLSLRRNYCEQE
jgi:hypothetical protein